MKLPMNQPCPGCGVVRSEENLKCRYHTCDYDRRVDTSGVVVTVMGRATSECGCAFCLNHEIYWTTEGWHYTKEGQLLTTHYVGKDADGEDRWTHEASNQSRNLTERIAP